MRSVTDLLEATRRGNKGAEAALFNLVYDDLRVVARRLLQGGMPNRLQTTSLVNETYLRIAGVDGLPFNDRGHLFAVAARAMRQITVDHARAALTHKRGGGVAPIELADHLAAAEHADPAQVVALDDALERLAAYNARMAQVVELRFFGGFELDELVPLLGVGARTLKRDWRVARAFLHDLLKDEEG